MASPDTSSIIEAIRVSSHDLKKEIHTYFATKADLETWKLTQYKDTERQVKTAVGECHKKNHTNRIAQHIRNPYTIGAGLVALASAIAAVAQALL